MKRLLAFAIIVCCVFGILSCGTVSVKYDKNIDYEIQEIVYPNAYFFNKKKIEHQEYALVFLKDLKESTLPEYNNGGFFSDTTGIRYNFYKGDTILAKVDIFKITKGFTFAKRSLYMYDSLSYIKTSNAFGMNYEYQIDEKSKTTVLENTTCNIVVEPIREIHQKDKTYTLWNNEFSGVRIVINKQEYAIVDFMTNPRILYNKNFSQILDDTCKHHVVLLMLSLYDYNRSLAHKNIKPTKDTQ